MKEFEVEIKDNLVVGELLVTLGVDRARADRFVEALDIMTIMREDMGRVGVKMTFRVGIEAPDVLRQAKDAANE